MKGGTISCIFLHETPVDIYAYKIPVFLLLFINSIIMIWIMLVNRDSKDIFIQLFFNHEYLNRGFNLYFTFSSKHEISTLFYLKHFSWFSPNFTNRLPLNWTGDISALWRRCLWSCPCWGSPTSSPSWVPATASPPRGTRCSRPSEPHFSPPRGSLLHFPTVT